MQDATETMQEAAENKTASRALGWVKLVLSIIAYGVLFVTQMIAMLVAGKLVSGNEIMQAGVGECIAAVVALLILVLLGGRRWIPFSGADIAYAFRVGWIVLLIGIVTMGISIVQALGAGSPIPSGAGMRLLGVTLLGLGIGFLEEAMYRGIVLGGLLAVLGRSRWGVMAAVILASIVFGYAHVGAADFSTASTTVQAILKIVQTAMFGIIMSDIMLHTRTIGGAAIFHAVNDFLLMAFSAVMSGAAAEGSYTTSEYDLWMVALAYGIMIVVELYPTICSIRRIWGEQSRCTGPLMKDGKIEESAA